MSTSTALLVFVFGRLVAGETQEIPGVYLLQVDAARVDGNTNLQDPDTSRTLILGSHHKTGTCLMGGAQECIKRTTTGEVKIEQDIAFDGIPHSGHHGINLIRSPLSWLVSAFLYHRNHGEAWSEKPMREIIADASQIPADAQRDESYTKYLHRVDMVTGAYFEARRSGIERWALDVNVSLGGVWFDIVDSTYECNRHSNCENICLESFTDSSASYNRTWKSILEKNSWYHVTPELADCLSSHDLNQHTSAHSHDSYVTKQEMDKALSAVKMVDKVNLNGKLSDYAPCSSHDGPSSFSRGGGADEMQESVEWFTQESVQS